MYLIFVPVFALYALPVSDTAVRDAVANALPPLRAAAVGHIEQKSCFGCHNQGPPTVALAAARGRGFTAFAADDLFEQADHILDFVADNRDRYLSGRGTGGQVDTAGTILLALEQTGHEPDRDTEAVVEYLLKTQPKNDHWQSRSKRPPSEASDFTATYLALRGLRVWATTDQRDRAETRNASATQWLLKTPAKDTEDGVFRLLALKEVGATDAVPSAVNALLASQRADGGWGQLATMTSDAYATGTVLVALNWAGGLSTDHPAYRRGVGYLVRTQLADGTWRVKTRSKPFQPYYEGGFPHGKDQFISSAASGWAATALVLASPPAPVVASPDSRP